MRKWIFLAVVLVAVFGVIWGLHIISSHPASHTVSINDPGESFEGEIKELKFDAAGRVSSMVIFDSIEKSEYDVEYRSYEVFVSEDTEIYAPGNEMNVEDFWTGKYVKVGVKGTGKINKEKDSKYYADSLSFSSVLTDKKIVLNDGTEVSVWSDNAYALENGTNLMSVSLYMPDFVYMNYGIPELSESSKNNIYNYYEELGYAFDEKEYLEIIYSEYKEKGQPDNFSGYLIIQAPRPIAANDKYLFYALSSDRIVNEKAESFELGAVFDKSTGNKVDNLEMFSLDRSEVLSTLIRMSGESDQTIIKDLQENFIPEYILFYDNRLGMVFPAGVLPSHEETYAVWFEYDDNISSLFKEGAEPDHIIR